jgi:hypothetical protein
MEKGDRRKPNPKVKPGKKKYAQPQLVGLTPEQAKAMLRARGLPDSPVIKQLLEWAAEVERSRTGKK